MEPDFWQQIGNEKNAALGAAIAFSFIFLLANLNWRVTVRAWVGNRPYPSPSRIRFSRFFLVLCLLSTIWNLGSELWRIPQTRPDIWPALAIAAFTTGATLSFFGILRFFSHVKPLTDAEIARKLPAEYSVRIADGILYNDRTDGEVEAVPLKNLASISLEKRTSQRAGHRVWFILEGKQGHRAAFPESAVGCQMALKQLCDLYGFTSPDPTSTSENKILCWQSS
jgi:hypothetical protein